MNRSMTSKKPTFESQLANLEAIVDNLEQGELSLEESLSQYEKGVKLTRKCQELLNQAEQKVAILSQDEESLEAFNKD